MKYQLFTAEEVAEILKVSKKTVYNYIRSGKIKAIKFGNNVRITEEDLKDFIYKEQKK